MCKWGYFYSLHMDYFTENISMQGFTKKHDLLKTRKILIKMSTFIIKYWLSMLGSSLHTTTQFRLHRITEDS